MLDRTNQIMVLSDDEKYVILKQFNYPEATYFYADKLSKDEETPLEEFAFFQSVLENNVAYMQEVKDEKIIKELKQIIETDF